MSKDYSDRHRVKEAVDYDGLLSLIEDSRAGDFDHRAEPGLESRVLSGPSHHPFPHIVNDHWIRNMFQGNRVNPFYGIQVSPTFVDSSPGTHDSGIRCGEPWDVSPEDNRHSTSPIGDVSVRFECPIESFHKVEKHVVVVFPCSDMMSERAARDNRFEYERRVTRCREAVRCGARGLDPFIMWVDLPQLIEEKKVWKKGSWGYYLKENPVDYSVLEDYPCSKQ
jgi:hypothetical protein